MEEKKAKNTTPEMPFDLIQEDPISRFFIRAWDFCHTRTKEVLIAGTVLVVTVSSVAGYITWKQKVAEEASTRLGLALQKAQSSGGGAVSGEILSEVREIAGSFSGTLAGRMAHLHEARMLVEKGDAAGALKAYDRAFEVLRGDELWEKLVAWERAYVHMGLGDRRAALEDFTKAASDGGFLEESALFHMARMQADMGEEAKSRSTMDRLLERYPDSAYKNMAL